MDTWQREAMKDSGAISVAVGVALAPIAHLEEEWDFEKLKAKVCHCVCIAATGIDKKSQANSSQGDSWKLHINKFADKVFCALFQGLSDRKWLQQADLSLILDAGVKELVLPEDVLFKVPTEDLEREVLNANDRAFEEQRYLHALWEAVKQEVGSFQSAKKVYEAAEAGRKAVIQDDHASIEEFIGAWINTTIANLAFETGGSPRQLLSQEIAPRIFHSLVSGGAGLPSRLSALQEPTDDHERLVSDTVEQAYRVHEQEAGSAAPHKRTWMEAGLPGHGAREGPGGSKGKKGKGSAARREGDWDCQSCEEVNFAWRKACVGCGAQNPNPTEASSHQREGDWSCQACSKLNFAYRDICLSCGCPNHEAKASVGKGGGLFLGSKGRGKTEPPKQHREGDWTCSACDIVNFGWREACVTCGIANPSPAVGFGSAQRREGDWDCGGCGKLNFAYREACIKCAAANPSPVTSSLRRTGDWDCAKCNKLNFAYRDACMECGTANPNPRFQHREGDWDCDACGKLNFAYRTECMKCEAVNPSPVASSKPRRDGDWDCAGCAKLNFAYRDSCIGCGAKNPAPATSSLRRDGDWDCKHCSKVNFSYRQVCCGCGAPPAAPSYQSAGKAKSSKGGGKQGGKQLPGGKSAPGDWSCSGCGSVNFAFRQSCFSCGSSSASAPAAASTPAVKPAGRRVGDWDCSKCGTGNFEHRDACKTCGSGKPGAAMAGGKGSFKGGGKISWAAPSKGKDPYKGESKGESKGKDKGKDKGKGKSHDRRPGDWDCSGCGKLNFAYRTACVTCGGT